jgi:hypothetical protein
MEADGAERLSVALEQLGLHSLVEAAPVQATKRMRDDEVDRASDGFRCGVAEHAFP